MKEKIYFSRDEMFEMNRDLLLERGVTIEDIAAIAFRQQSKYNPNICMKTCIESVEKILSYRDIFHIVQLSVEIDRLCEEGKLRSPMQEIIRADLAMYGVIGQTNFGDIDVNKPGIVKELNDHGKGTNERCHTFLDDVVGALAAAASTRVAQISSEETAKKDPHYEPIKFDL